MLTSIVEWWSSVDIIMITNSQKNKKWNRLIMIIFLFKKKTLNKHVMIVCEKSLYALRMFVLDFARYLKIFLYYWSNSEVECENFRGTGLEVKYCEDQESFSRMWISVSQNVGSSFQEDSRTTSHCSIFGYLRIRI